MRSMRRVLAFALLGSVTAAMLSGCGGNSLIAAVTGSPFIGSYKGTFTTDKGQSGSTSFTVATGGSFAGQMHNDTTGLDGSLSGSIDDAGNFSGTVAYASGAIGLTGPVTLTNSKHLDGTLQVMAGGVPAGSLTLSADIQ